MDNFSEACFMWFYALVRKKLEPHTKKSVRVLHHTVHKKCKKSTSVSDILSASEDFFLSVGVKYRIYLTSGDGRDLQSVEGENPYIELCRDVFAPPKPGSTRFLFDPLGWLLPEINYFLKSIFKLVNWLKPNDFASLGIKMNGIVRQRKLEKEHGGTAFNDFIQLFLEVSSVPFVAI